MKGYGYIQVAPVDGMACALKKIEDDHMLQVVLLSGESVTFRFMHYTDIECVSNKARLLINPDCDDETVISLDVFRYREQLYVRAIDMHKDISGLDF